jgi:hypothetical protein
MSLESPSDGRLGEKPARRVLDDPLALRAFAHPLRLALHRLLVREGRCSAAYAGRELDISQALASHHLRQLAKYGFAEQVTGGDRRERPWRALSTSMTWMGADATDEGAVAADLLEQALVEQTVSNLLTWQRLRRRPDESGWHEVVGLDTSLLYLTAGEVDELGRRFDELCRPFVARRHDPTLRPDEARPVEVTLLAVPLTPTSSGA